jgi:hypothetical protein
MTWATRRCNGCGAAHAQEGQGLRLPAVEPADYRLWRAVHYGFARRSGVCGGSPAYDPLIVFAPPRPGFVLGAAIGFGFGIAIGTWFHPWGWGASRIYWDRHEFFVNNARWDRTWVNRRVYVHPYPAVHRYEPARRVKHHEVVHRSAAEREAARHGHEVHEEHQHH